MKKGIHPESYRLVAFKDMSNEHVFITRSCVNTKETIEVNGVEFPLVKVEISNTSHPFYTGKMKLVDTAGRVDKFYSRYGQKKKYLLLQRKKETAARRVAVLFISLRYVFIQNDTAAGTGRPRAPERTRRRAVQPGGVASRHRRIPL